jgi:D-arabinose 1-dehydrogenase-like Zn-dependent alcohol dehydrogenase
MPQEVRGVVAHKKGDPVSVETIVVPDPGPGEAVVEVQACGVCHTDLHYREGGINDDFPFLLGHEAAGIVEAVGEGVTDVARRATSSSSTGGRSAGTAGPAAAASRGTASPPTTPRRR